MQQQQQIQAVREANSYQAKVKLNQQSLAELKRWKENLLLQNGKPLKIGIPQLMIQTDSSKRGSLSGDHHGGNLVISRKDKTYQYTGAHCSETCNIDFYQGQIRNNNPLTNRQYDSSVLLVKNEGNSQSRTATSSQGNLYGYAFPPFCLVGKVLAKVRKDQSLLLIITPVWQTQPWYAALLAMSVQHPIILPNLTTLLQRPHGQKHPLQEGNQLQLVAWKVSGKLWKVREYKNSLPHLSQIPEGQGQYLITNRPGESGLAGVVNGRLIPLQVI